MTTDQWFILCQHYLEPRGHWPPGFCRYTGIPTRNTDSFQRLTTAVFFFLKTRQQPPYNALISYYINGGSPDQDHTSIIFPPPEGFPTGSHFRTNLVDPNNHNAIYAQSNEFTIKNWHFFFFLALAFACSARLSVVWLFTEIQFFFFFFFAKMHACTWIRVST